MTVYIEDVFFINFAVDLCLTYTCGVIVDRVSVGRSVGAAAVGGVLALAYPMVNSLRIMYALMVPIVVSGVYIGGKSVGQFARFAVCELILTMCAGGIADACSNLLYGLSEAQNTVYGYLIFAIIAFLCALYCRRIKTRFFAHMPLALYSRVVLSCGGRRCEVVALRDSGNLLRFRGHGVMIVSQEVISKLQPHAMDKELNVATINGNVAHALFRLDYMSVEGETTKEYKDIYCIAGMVEDGEYSVILPIML